MQKTMTDVLIVGNGIAGSVLSLLLKRRGIDHVLLARNEQRKSIGLSETLPPSTLSLLENMELLELFETSSSRTYGYHSSWGNDKLASNDFFFHNPFKYGLKLKKPELLSSIEKELGENVFRFNALLDVEMEDGNAQVKISIGKKEQIIESKLVIDATGRNRAVLKQLDIPVVSFDEQVCFTCHLPFKKHPALIHKVFVESFEHGWGIVSSLNKEINVMTIFTQKGNPIQKELKNYGNWDQILAQTKGLKYFLQDNFQAKVLGGNANSSKSSKLTGENWLTVGDAAISFDPLSSHGVSNAIYTANEAAKAVDTFLNNSNSDSLKEYDEKLSNIFQGYLAQKSKLYETEKRWMDSPYWKNIFTQAQSVSQTNPTNHVSLKT